MADDEPRKVEGELLPPSTQQSAPKLPGNLEPRMPLAVRFGIGAFGVGKFNAIRRVFEAMERANLAEAGYHASQGAVADAMTRKVSAFTQLDRLDIIRNDTAQRIEAAYEHTKHARAAALRAEETAIELHEIEKFRRKLDLLEAQEAFRLRQEQINRARGGQIEQATTSKEEAEFMALFAKMPDLVRHVEAAKAKIIADAGGEGNISESIQAVLDTLDPILQATLAKKQEQAL
jgi:hypothetical protein